MRKTPREVLSFNELSKAIDNQMKTMGENCKPDAFKIILSRQGDRYSLILQFLRNGAEIDKFAISTGTYDRDAAEQDLRAPAEDYLVGAGLHNARNNKTQHVSASSAPGAKPEWSR